MSMITITILRASPTDHEHGVCRYHMNARHCHEHAQHRFRDHDDHDADRNDDNDENDDDDIEHTRDDNYVSEGG